MSVPMDSPMGRRVLAIMAEQEREAVPADRKPPPLYVTVPVPPSTNNLFVTVGRRRVKSREYREWMVDAVPEMMKLGPPMSFPAQVSITLLGGPGLNLYRDLDNIAKPVLDALVAASVLPGDSLRHVWRVALEYLPRTGLGIPPAVMVGVRPLEVL